MTQLVVSTPDLLSVHMSKEEVDKAFGDLKRFTRSMVDNRVSAEHHTRIADRDEASACELAFRLKENDNWKKRDGGYTSWSDCVNNEFGGSLRQEVDRMVKMHQVNRALPEPLQITRKSHAEVMVQVPDEQKENVIKAAKKKAPKNKHTNQPQVSAKLLAKVAKEQGVVIRETKTTLKREDPRNFEPECEDKIAGLVEELKSIRNFIRPFGDSMWQSIVIGITKRLKDLGLE